MQPVAAEVNLGDRHPLHRRGLRTQVHTALDTRVGAADDRGVAPSAVLVGVRTHNPHLYGVYPDFLGSLSKRRRGVTLTLPLRATWNAPGAPVVRSSGAFLQQHRAVADE